MARYIYRKIQLLKQFHIDISKDTEAHLYLLKTEIAVDNYARTIIKNYI